MQREIEDSNGITWACVEAFSGLSDGEENRQAAKVKGCDDLYHVVCTPSGGERSVRLQLPGDWKESYSDEALSREIEKNSR